MAVRFYNESISIKVKNKARLRSWIIHTSEDFGRTAKNINYIFVSKYEIRTLNSKFLNHTYFTDIISFDYSTEFILSGDIYIAPEIVSENSEAYNTTFNEELKRVLIHGILHLIGFKDKTSSEAKEMRLMEDKYLAFVKDLIII